MGLISNKVAPALLAGCTVILKSSPEAPGEGYLIAEAAEAAGLPPGVLNVVTADREVSELLVRDQRVLRSGTVGHNAFRTDFGIAFGGFKQSGIGREGGREGLLPFLETKTVILEGRPAGYEDTVL